jgi:MFS family permease
MVDTNSYPPAKIGWYTTILLGILYWVSLLDRTIISLMVDPIKKDLGITDVQFGLLHGVAFAITFSIFGLVAGFLADRSNRRKIVFWSVAIWSLATAACGLAQNFWHLLLARVGVGAGEAGLNPAATSMITDLFPPERRNFPMAVYALGASVGAGCAFIFGGVIIDMVSSASSIVLPIIGEVAPWQAVFMIIGAPGILIAFLVFVTPEPKRIGKKSENVSENVFATYSRYINFISSQKLFFTCHYIGFGFASLSFVAGAAWYPAHAGRTFQWPSTDIGLFLGTAMIIGGIFGKFICGNCLDWLTRRGHKDAHFIYAVAVLALATPIGIIGLTSSDSWVFLSMISLIFVLMSPIAPMYVGALNIATPNELRGSGVAFYSATIGLIALSAGPVLVAYFSEIFFAGQSIGKGMATLFGISCPIGALVLFLGRKAMQKAVDDAGHWRQD